MRTTGTSGIVMFAVGVVGFVANVGGVAQGLETIYGSFNIPLTYDTFVVGLMAVGIALITWSVFGPQQPDAVAKSQAEMNLLVQHILAPEFRRLLAILKARILTLKAEDNVETASCPSRDEHRR